MFSVKNNAFGERWIVRIVRTNLWSLLRISIEIYIVLREVVMLSVQIVPLFLDLSVAVKVKDDAP
jgi:hypothetical protein